MEGVKRMILDSPETFVDETEKEGVKMGTAAFPIACYYDTRIYAMWHWHEEFEVHVVEKGSVIFRVGRETHVLKAGEAAFVNSRGMHEIEPAGEEETMDHCVCWHPRLVGGSPESVFWQDYVEPLAGDKGFQGMKLSPEVPWQKTVIDCIESCWLANEREEPGYTLHSRNMLSEVLFQFCEHRKVRHAVPTSRELLDASRIRLMIQYIHENYSEELSSGRIAEFMEISESECLRCFRRTIHTTPMQYVQQYRIQKAAYLLEHTGLKIIDIGIQCGFQEMGYFAKVFRKLKGCTPSEWRKEKAGRKNADRELSDKNI